MEVLYPRCAGVDVHASSVTACVRIASGADVTYQHRTVAATTQGLLELADWFAASGCTHVAMEATGVYWKPVWHVLEEQFTLVLANAMHIRNVPGRKSDTNDATWIADLLAHGLIRGSFVPPAPIQELRDLTRTRKQTGGGNRATHPAYPKDPGGRQSEADPSRHRHPGHQRASDSQGADCGRDRPGPVGRCHHGPTPGQPRAIGRRAPWPCDRASSLPDRVASDPDRGAGRRRADAGGPPRRRPRALSCR